MYATFAFAITMLGVFSIFENLKGNQKFSVLKYYILLTIICFTTSSFLDFLNFSGHPIPYYKEISRVAGAILVLNMLFLIVLKKVPKFIIYLEIGYVIFFIVEILLGFQFPEIALDHRFALHGGTAINLFHRDMPRLSVDVDLTYIPIEDRETSFTNISVALTNIKSTIEKRLQGSRVEHKVELHKLLVSHNDAIIKIEVSQIVRGTLGAVTEKMLCKKVQEKFDTFCSINIVPNG